MLGHTHRARNAKTIGIVVLLFLVFVILMGNLSAKRNKAATDVQMQTSQPAPTPTRTVTKTIVQHTPISHNCWIIIDATQIANNDLNQLVSAYGPLSDVMSNLFIAVGEHDAQRIQDLSDKLIPIDSNSSKAFNELLNQQHRINLHMKDCKEGN